MHTSTKQKTLIGFAVAVVAFISGIFIIYRLGFGAMAASADVPAERLRDFTFSIWDHYSPLKHGFLTFLTADGYEKHEAYGNHGTFFLLIMNIFYHIHHVIPKFTMRLCGALFAMLLSMLAIAYVINRSIWEKIDLRHCILLLLAAFYFMTIPTFWISLGKFNIDNAFVLVFPVLLVASHLVAKNGPRGKHFWISTVLLCLVMPMAGALFGLFVLIRTVAQPRANLVKLLPACAVMVIASLIYIQPIIVMKLLGFSSMNSSWLFRSGLDGDTSLYGNFIDSVLFPQFNRPAYMVLIPLALLIATLFYRKKFSGTDAGIIPGDNPKNAMPYAFSVYFLMLLFWPQSIAIHPYLYDALLVGPIGAWIVINFAQPLIYQRHFTIWLFVLCFLITFNLTKIAQSAHCTGCFFPSWGMHGERAGGL